MSPATKTAADLLVADECWIALARLHRLHPERTGFTAREIADRAAEDAGVLRPGIQPHIYQHNVANVAPSSARYRMTYRLPDGTYRLYRPGDDAHPSRHGKTMPEHLPAHLHELLDWYRNEYCKRGSRPVDEDPVLQMIGVGKELWQDESGDAFVARERSGWDEDHSGSSPLVKKRSQFTARPARG